MNKLKISLVLGHFLIYFGARAADTALWQPVKLAGHSASLKVTGRIAAKEGAMRIEPARVQGRIMNILKKEGDVVESGTPLFEISSGECISLVEEKGAAEKQGLAELVEGTNRRQKQLGIEIKNGQCQLVSSYSGTIVKRQVELGAIINIGDPIVTILDVKSLTVELEIPERALSQVTKNQEVVFRLASSPSQVYTTRIEHLLPTIDVTTRTSKAKLKAVHLPKNVNLEELVFAEVLGNSDDQLLKVPTSAFVFHQNRHYVVKKTATIPVVVAVEIVDESETESTIRPIKPEELKEGDIIAVKDAIFIFEKTLSGKASL